MLDFTRFSWYDLYSDGQTCGFFIAQISYLCYHNTWPRLNQTASTVASIRNTVEYRGFNFLNAKTAIVFGWSPHDDGSQKRIAMKVYCATLHIIPDLKVWCQPHIPKISQLYHNSESPGGTLWHLYAAGDSPSAPNSLDLAFSGEAFPLYPRSFLISFPDSPPAPVAGSPVIGAGGLFQGGGA